MVERRRSFVKNALTGAAVVGASASLAMAKTKNVESSNGVVKGHSPKKEILYRETEVWKAFYKSNY